MARSTDGGKSRSGSRATVANVTDVGAVRRRARRSRFDGIAGARTELVPEPGHRQRRTDRCRGDRTRWRWAGPTGRRAQPRARPGAALRQRRLRAGANPVQVEQSGDRPDFAFIGLSPNGQRPIRRLRRVQRSVPERHDEHAAVRRRDAARGRDGNARSAGWRPSTAVSVGDSRASSLERADRRVHRATTTRSPRPTRGRCRCSMTPRNAADLSGDRYVPAGDRSIGTAGCSAGAADRLPVDVRQHGHILGRRQRPNTLNVREPRLAPRLPSLVSSPAPSSERDPSGSTPG